MPFQAACSDFFDLKKKKKIGGGGGIGISGSHQNDFSSQLNLFLLSTLIFVWLQLGWKGFRMNRGLHYHVSGMKLSYRLGL